MTVKDDFSARLRAAMKAVGMKASGTELEREFNRRWRKAPITVQTASSWISGKHLPRPDKLPLLAKLLGVKPQDLWFGAQEPLTAAERPPEWADGMDDAERRAIEAFLRLPSAQRVIVGDVIATYAKAHGVSETGQG